MGQTFWQPKKAGLNLCFRGQGELHAFPVERQTDQDLQILRRPSDSRLMRRLEHDSIKSQGQTEPSVP